MKLGNLILLAPNTVLAVLAKTVRLNLTEKVNNIAVEKGFYHCVPNKEVGNKILDSGKIRASKGILNAYGKSAAFMFLGIPNLENYLKNLISDPRKNILMAPEQIVYAIKMEPKLEELSNYKTRLADNVILHEGDCIIPEERTKLTQLVLDLVRDENGTVILDNKGQKQIAFRERTEAEIQRDGDEYKPSSEFLEAIEGYKKNNGYAQKDFLNIRNTTNTILHVTELEGKYALNNSLDFIKNFMRGVFNSQKKLDENPNAKIFRITKEIEQGQADTKKPVRDKKYVSSIIELNRQGIHQQMMSKVLQEFRQSKEAKFLEQKMSDLNSNAPIKRKGIHGHSHSDRVTMLAFIIAQREGINLDNRMLDILASAGYYHDIGRILNQGPHAKRSVKLVDKKKLVHSNGEAYSKEDMNILKAVINAHEGNEEKAIKMLNKYGVEPQDIDSTLMLTSILRDADALDRARLSSKASMNLKPRFLKTKAAKGLIDFSFQFEALTQNVKNFSSILSYDVQDAQIKGKQKKSMANRQSFLEDLQKGVKPPLNELEQGEKPVVKREVQYKQTLNKELEDDELENG